MRGLPCSYRREGSRNVSVSKSTLVLVLPQACWLGEEARSWEEGPSLAPRTARERGREPHCHHCGPTLAGADGPHLPRRELLARWPCSLVSGHLGGPSQPLNGMQEAQLAWTGRAGLGRSLRQGHEHLHVAEGEEA